MKRNVGLRFWSEGNTVALLNREFKVLGLAMKGSVAVAAGLIRNVVVVDAEKGIQASR